MRLTLLPIILPHLLVSANSGVHIASDEADRPPTSAAVVSVADSIQSCSAEDHASGEEETDLRASLLSFKHVVEGVEATVQEESPEAQHITAASNPARPALANSSAPSVKALMQSEQRQPDPGTVSDTVHGFAGFILDIGTLAHRTVTELHSTFSRFFPGLIMRKSVMMDLLMTTSMTCLWFAFYLSQIYKTDRTELSHTWAHYEEEARRIPDDEKDRLFDMIIAVPKPKDESAMSSAELAFDGVSVPLATLKAIFPQFSRVWREVHSGDKWFGEVMSLATAETSGRVRRNSFTATTGDALSGLSAGRVSLSGNQLLKSQVRRYLLHDLAKFLPGVGFDVVAFRSCTDADVFLGISLSRDQAIKHYLDRDSVLLQIKDSIVPKLGIDQPMEDPLSSPPLMKYDPRAEVRLKQANVIEKGLATELYAITTPGTKGDMSILKGSERFSIIYKEISTHMTLELAKHETIISDFYAVHDEFQLEILRRTWSSSLKLDLVQPVNLVESYFGSSIAFRAAWVGLYCKGLLGLLPVAVCYIVVDTVLDQWKHHGEARMDRMAEELEGKHLLGFSVVLVIWARVMFNLWVREEKFFGSAWEVKNEDLGIGSPFFRGEFQKSKIDRNIEERQYSTAKALMWRYLSWFVVALMCFGVVGSIYIQKEVVNEQAPLALSFFMTVQINVFELAFNLLASSLTNWENHRRRVGHKNSYLLKQAIFQSVNNFYPFIYLIIKQANATQDCPGGACLMIVREQLRSALVLLSFSRIFLFGLRYIWVRISELIVEAQMKLGRAAEVEQVKVIRPMAERQSLFIQYDTIEETWAMLESVISLGHALLFGAIVREAIPLALGVFIMSRHSTAFVLTTFAKRPFPQSADGIGAWQDVISLVMKGGVLTNTFCIVAFGESFRGVATAARVSGFISIAAILFLAIGVVDLIFAPADRDVKLLEARRRHVSQAVNHVGRKQGHPSGQPRFTAECLSAAAIEADQYDLIPTYAELSTHGETAQGETARSAASA